MILTKDNYFSSEANAKYMSNSQFKSFMDCEAATMAKIKGEWIEKPTEAMKVGSYGHAWNEGPEAVEIFKNNNPDMFISTGKTKGQLKAQYKVVENAIKVMENDVFFMSALTGKKEILFTAELFRIEWKILIDVYYKKKKRFSDLKILKSLTERFYNKEKKILLNVFQYRGYYTQVALYAEIERLANGRDDGDYFEPFIAVVTKEKYPDKAVVRFSSGNIPFSEFIKRELQYVAVNIEHIKEVKNESLVPLKCNICDYCRSKKVLTGTQHYSDFELY